MKGAFRVRLYVDKMCITLWTTGEIKCEAKEAGGQGWWTKKSREPLCKGPGAAYVSASQLVRCVSLISSYDSFGLTS